MCTSVIAGKKATSDGTTLIARNEDFGINNWNKYMKYRSKPQYSTKNEVDPSTEKMWTLGNGLQVPVPSKSFSYCSIPDAAGNEEAAYSIGDHFYFEERGINECNVAISATNSMGINEKALSADPLVSVGIEESIILTLILPQSESAREAVELLGNYVETYGASEGNGILISDANEVWYFEVGSCHHWIAVRVPEDSYVVIANCMRVHSIDLEDTENVKHSKGLYDFVVQHHLLDNPERNHFNFAKAFGYPGSIVDGKLDPYCNVDRLWLAQSILTPSKKQPVRMEEYPLFLKPDKKVNVSVVMNLLRATYKNTELEGIATRPIGVVRTAESHIMTIDSELPGSLKGVIWQTLSSPLGSPYMPIFAITDKLPVSYSLGDSQYSPSSAYWSFRSLFSLSSVNENEYMSILKTLWEKYENQFVKEYKNIKSLLIDMANTNYDEAVHFAKKYSTGVMCQMVEAANGQLSALITTISENQNG
ncbi:MAG: C69 family dipeptidase [Bacillota bacterium]